MRRMRSSARWPLLSAVGFSPSEGPLDMRRSRRYVLDWTALVYTAIIRTGTFAHMHYMFRERCRYRHALCVRATPRSAMRRLAEPLNRTLDSPGKEGQLSVASGLCKHMHGMSIDRGVDTCMRALDAVAPSNVAIFGSILPT